MQGFKNGAKCMRRQSERPIFDAKGRDFAEVRAVAGEEYSVVSEGDGGDL